MATKTEGWDKLSAANKIRGVHIDAMRHKQFALLSGVMMVGDVKVTDKFPGGYPFAGPPTAMTNGRDVWYGETFVGEMSRKQLRYVVLHENFHKALRHCHEYMDVSRKYPMYCAVATDLCVNGLIEEMDPKFEFVERPTSTPPLVDKKFDGWSFMRILKYLLQKYPPPPEGGKGKGQGKPGGDPMDPRDNGNGGFDHHEAPDEANDGKGMTDAEQRQLKREIDEAVRHGKILQQKIAGNEAGGRDLSSMIEERDTRWKEYLREFVTQIVKGDDMSRFIPPNKRMLASGFMMPSHFSESTGELHIYCDTSGSMTGYYPIVFGEVAQIIKDVRPDLVRVIWWDTAVAGEQVFKPDQYDQIATLLKPAGGGGTTPDVIRHYVDKMKYTAKCGVVLSDGDFYTSALEMPWPILWGILGNDNFQPSFGKVVNINVD